MSFKEWLYVQLLNDNVIDDSTDVSEISEEMVLEDTELEEYDIENYRTQFVEHCDSLGVEPTWDVE